MDMIIKNRLCFPQFIHPGGEHGNEAGNIKKWNKKDHKRKFLVNDGSYVDQIQGTRINERLGFWGEWEPESKVSIVENRMIDGPRYIHIPFYKTPTKYEELQNTDPYVFGDQFLYSNCRQYKNGKPTQLRELSKGSVILFGSCLRNNFVLDTVFVVRDYLEFNNSRGYEKINGKVPDAFMETTILPLCNNFCVRGCVKPSEKDHRYRLYFGATIENKYEGMFSYFPTQPFYRFSNGFARPVISIPNVITDNLNIGFKINPQEKIGDVQKLWVNVSEQVLKQGLKLGVWSAIPLKE